MSNTVNQNSQAMYALARLSKKFEATGDNMNEFMSRQANGEGMDPAAFSQMVSDRLMQQDAMRAQFQLYEKPLKTAMNEAK